PCTAAPVAEPHPDKMEKLVEQDAFAHQHAALQPSIEKDQALADKRSRMSGIAGGIAEVRLVADFHRMALELHPLTINPWQPAGADGSECWTPPNVHPLSMCRRIWCRQSLRAAKRRSRAQRRRPKTIRRSVQETCVRANSENRTCCVESRPAAGRRMCWEQLM